MGAAAPHNEPYIEAVEWMQPAEGGGSRSQVFRLEDGRYALVKFPENPQGQRVLINEFVACRVAELLRLPVNRAVLVDVDDRLLERPKATGSCPAAFSGGVRCGLIRYQGAQPVNAAWDLLRQTVNADELHGVLILEQLVKRGDGRQLLVYQDRPHGRATEQSERRFAAYDYGFAFGGSPNWTLDSLNQLAPPQLPTNDAFNQPYTTGDPQSTTTQRLREMEHDDLQNIVAALAPSHWGLAVEEGERLVEVIEERAWELVRLYDERYRPQLEVFNEQ